MRIIVWTSLLGLLFITKAASANNDRPLLEPRVLTTTVSSKSLYFAPVNDGPCSAIELPVSAGCIFSGFTNSGALGDLYPSSGCVTIERDVFFKVTVPASGILNIRTKAGTLTDAEMGLYTGSSCIDLAEIACNKDSSATNPMPYVSRSGLVPGATVWIRISSLFQQGTFEICVTSPGVPNPPRKNIYVNQVATGANNGTNWDNAFNNITAAMGASGEGDTLRIAEGLYRPRDMYGPSPYSLKEGMVILGGYPNSGNPQHSNRHVGTHPTILSGEVYRSPDANLPYIFRAVGLTANTIIDGIIFQKTFSTVFGSGPGAYGTAALTLVSSSIVVKNCVFRQCGGGPVNAPAIAVSLVGGTNFISNCFFVENTGGADLRAAAVYALNSNTVFANCVFARNTMYAQVMNDAANLTFTNCTFFGNQGWLYQNTLPAFKTVLGGINASSTSIRNSIFFHNKINSPYFSEGILIDSTEFAIDASSQLSISNTVTQVYKTGNNQLLNVDPKFQDSARIAGADNFYFTADDGLILSNPCSDLINQGNNTFTAAAYDMLGNARVYGGNTDLGAYEVQAALLQKPAVVYVNKLATGLNNGGSWANAFTDLQLALKNCSDTVKVAAGIYFASSINNPLASFWLHNKRVIMGGYPNTGNPSDGQRNPAAHTTMLSGDSVQNNNNVYSIIKSLFTDSTAVIDGFTIAFGNSAVAWGTSGILGVQGAAIVLTENASPVFRNCIFYKNVKSYAVGIDLKKNARPRFESCLFKNNQFPFMNARNSAASFWLCRFEETGHINNDSSRMIFDSCSFINKIALPTGAGIRNYRNSHVTINRSVFNLAHVTRVPNDPGGDIDNNGGDIFNDRSTLIVSNSKFTDSTTAANGNCLYNSNQSTASFYKCVFQHGYQGNAYYNDSSVLSFDHSISLNRTSLVLNKRHATLHLKNSVFAASPYYPDNLGNGINFLNNNNSAAFITNSTLVTSNSIVLHNANNGTMDIKNSVLWSSESLPGSSEITSDNTGNISLSNCLTQFSGANGVNGNMVGKHPRFTNMHDVAGPDKLYFTADDGFTLCSCSPIVNAGYDEGNSGALDLAGTPRIFGSQVDIGAYEFQSANTTEPGQFYVNSVATGNNSGSSWQNAYNNIADAFRNYCADSIKIAAGVYNVAAHSDTGLNVIRPIQVSGGYPADQPADSLRNPDLYPTVLEGNIGNPASVTDNSRWLMRIYSNTIPVKIDGLTFQNVRGTSLRINKNSALVSIVNCKFTDNLSIDSVRLYNPGGPFSGAAVQCTGSSSVFFERCQFLRNTGQRGGLDSDASASLIINSCVFGYNRAYLWGGMGASGPVKMFNTIFHNNSCDVRGAGAVTQDRVGDSIINCSFINNNNADTRNINNRIGIGLFVFTNTSNVPNTVVANSIFYNNTYKGQVLANAPFLGLAPSTASGVSTTKYLKVFNNAAEGAVRLQTLFPAAGTGNILSTGILLRDTTQPLGADLKYFTTDDGLQLLPASTGINSGLNSYVQNTPTDFIGNNRILNGTVDMGANEFNTTQVLCTQATAISMQSPVSGTTYQWQLNSGSGFANISNNSNFQGVSTATLQLSNIPFSWTGYKFRCIVNGVPAYEMPIEFHNLWLGTVSASWEDPLNWSCGVLPDAYSVVIVDRINNPPMHMPHLSSNQTIYSLVLVSGTSLQINAGYNLHITQ